jgi:hypothetical protein
MSWFDLFVNRAGPSALARARKIAAEQRAAAEERHRKAGLKAPPASSTAGTSSADKSIARRPSGVRTGQEREVAIGFIVLNSFETETPEIRVWSGNGQVSVGIPLPTSLSIFPDPRPPASEEIESGAPFAAPFQFVTDGFDGRGFFDSVFGIFGPKNDWWASGGVLTVTKRAYAQSASGRGYPWGYVIPLGGGDMIFVYKSEYWNHSVWEQVSSTTTWQVTSSEVINPDVQRVRYYITPTDLGRSQLGYGTATNQGEELFALLITFEGVRQIDVPGIMSERMSRIQPSISLTDAENIIDWPLGLGQSTWPIKNDGGLAANFPYAADSSQYEAFRESFTLGIRTANSFGGSQSTMDFLLGFSDPEDFLDEASPYGLYEIQVQFYTIETEGGSREAIRVLRYYNDTTTSPMKDYWVSPLPPEGENVQVSTIVGWPAGDAASCKAKARQLGFTDADFRL